VGRLHVTGATGRLGSEICRQAGIEPTPRVDVLDAEALAAAVAGAAVVIHTAYRQADARVNAEGSANVARAAAATGARLVHLSSDMVFSGRHGRPYDERALPDPITAYGASKAEAERLVAEACPEAVLVRTSLIYSDDEPIDPSWTYFDDEIRCPVHVADLAAACLELASRTDVSGPLHVAGADAVSRLQFAQLLSGRDDLRSGPTPPDRPRDLRLDCAKARGLLRTQPRGARTAAGRRR
jgi:dTDP-4-dehydrorhamnose reductase